MIKISSWVIVRFRTLIKAFNWDCKTLGVLINVTCLHEMKKIILQNGALSWAYMYKNKQWNLSIVNTFGKNLVIVGSQDTCKLHRVWIILSYQGFSQYFGNKIHTMRLGISVFFCQKLGKNARLQFCNQFNVNANNHCLRWHLLSLHCINDVTLKFQRF